MVESDSDSSSDSQDELKKFADAIYPEFKIIPTKRIDEETKGEQSKSEVSHTHIRDDKKRKSNRMSKSDDWECGHFVHPLKLPPSNQEFVSKQLALCLDKQIKETKSIKSRVEDEDVEDDKGIFLFQSSTRRIRGKDLRRHEKRFQRKAKVRKKSESDSEDDSKLQAVAVSAEWVLNPKNV